MKAVAPRSIGGDALDAAVHGSLLQPGAAAGGGRHEPELGGGVAVNRDFLLDALSAGHPEQLLLELGGPITPLAIRTPGRTGTFSVLMPIRLPDTA